jgi:hypothetical protein
MRKCSFEGCNRAHDCRGLCKTHNKQLQDGKELTAIKYVPKDPDDRFVQNIDNSGACWLWTGELNGDGYGRFGLAGKRLFAHRYAYELWREEIPEDSSVAHTCRTKACCNPDHLFIVSGKGGRAYHAVRDRLEARIAELEKENADLRVKLQLQVQEKASK